MKNKNYRVSRATLYNTIELLLESNLVIKHQFGKNIAQFEKVYQCKQHDHLICQTCGKVIEFCDPRIHEIKDTIKDMLEVPVLGIVPEDKSIRESQIKKNAVVYTHPKSKAAKSYRRAMKRVLGTDYFGTELEKAEKKSKGFLGKLFGGLFGSKK